MSQRSRKLHHEKHKRVEKTQKTNAIMKGIVWGLLRNFFVMIHLLFDFIIESFLGWYHGERKTCPALDKNAFIEHGAIDLAKMIREKQITSFQVVEAYINRMQQVNPVLNAILDGPYMEALEEAKALDERIAKGEISDEEFDRRPLLGVPFTTKDSTAVKDKLYTFCILSRQFDTATEDAECVRLLKESGAIIIAKTSIPEVNLWQETRNMLIGGTNNPYDTRRTVGGSSGGEAALISASATAFGIGTDIGGSIRMPAYYCGIYGHKGTVKVVNTRGVTNRTGKEECTMVVAGPMTRYAKDLLPLFKVLAGPEKTKALKLDAPVDLKSLKYYYMFDNGDIRCLSVSGEVKTAMKRVINHFSSLTCQPVKKVSLPGIEYTSKLWRYWMTKEPAVFSVILGNGRTLNPWIEVLKKITGQSEFTWGAVYSLINTGILPPENEQKMKKITSRLEQELEDLLGDDGILFAPSYPRTAPYHYAPLVQIYNFAYWCIWNVLHVPATQVPLGLNYDGLPLGLQVVATKNRDAHCMRVAEEIERELCGWIAPYVKTVDK